MNRLFDTSVNVGLRQFYVLGAAGISGNLFGFVGNVYIYGAQCADDFLCPVYIGHIWNDILGYPVQDM